VTSANRSELNGKFEVTNIWS